jgi:hypothetical protein
MPNTPLPPKPAWYLYAQEAQKILDQVKPSRSGSNEERAMLATYRTACAQKGYEGTEADWQFLLWQLRQTKLLRRQEPD